MRRATTFYQALSTLLRFAMWLVAIFGLFSTAHAQAESTAYAYAEGDGSIAIAVTGDLTIKDVRAIRRMLDAESRAQLDQVFADIEAQRNFLQGFIDDLSRQHRSVQRKTQQRIEAVEKEQARQRSELVAIRREQAAQRIELAAQFGASKLQAKLDAQIQRYRELEESLSAPGFEEALRLLQAGKLAEAEAAMHEVLEKQERTEKELPFAIARTNYNLGEVKSLRFDFDGAARYYRAAIRRFRTLRDAGHDSAAPELVA